MANGEIAVKQTTRPFYFESLQQLEMWQQLKALETGSNQIFNDPRDAVDAEL